MNEQALMDVVDRLRNRFFGKYRGVVTDIDASTLRIKATVPSVLAEPAHRMVHAMRSVCGSERRRGFFAGSRRRGLD